MFRRIEGVSRLEKVVWSSLSAVQANGQPVGLRGYRMA